MRLGGFLHQNLLLEPLEHATLTLGAKVTREYPVRIGFVQGYVDLWVEMGSRKIAVEAESTSRRLDKDLKKAALLKAELLVVVPNWRSTKTLRIAMERVLASSQKPPFVPSVLILPLGPAIEHLRRLCDFETRSLLTKSQSPNPQKITKDPKKS